MERVIQKSIAFIYDSLDEFIPKWYGSPGKHYKKTKLFSSMFRRRKSK
jgi:hypothetical protein